MKFQIAILLFVSSSLTACFEIREEVNMKADGSGEALLHINLGESKDNIKKYLQLEKTGGSSAPSDRNVEAVLGHIESILRGVRGISNVQVKRDWTDYKFSISSRFASVDVLNTAIASLSKKLDYLYLEPAGKPNYGYDYQRFQRFFDYPSKSKEYYGLPSLQRHALESARMVSVYRFEKGIKGFTNKKAQLSPSKKAIMLQLSVANLAKGLDTLANTISF